MLAAPAQEPATPSGQTPLTEAALLERALAAVEALHEPGGFSFEARINSLTRTKLVAGGETLSQGTYLEFMVDKGAWLSQGAQTNVVLRRNASFPGSDLHPMESELRLVDDQIYLRAAFSPPEPDTAVLPEGWLHVTGLSTLLYWPDVQNLSLEYTFRNLRQDPWALFSGYPAQVLDEVLTNHLESAQHATTVLQDGSPGEVITFVLFSSALPQTIRYLDMNPGNERAIATAQGSPTSLEFTLDEAGQLVAWELAIRFEVKDVDFSGISGAPQGSRLEGQFEQTVSVNLQRDPAPTPIDAPQESEIGDLPAISSAAAGASFRSLGDFDLLLNRAISEGTLDAFWGELSEIETMPLVFGDLAVFLYRGAAQSVAWNADWSNNRAHSEGRLDGSDVWMHAVRLPPDARLEYQIQLDGEDPILDPLNPRVEVGGLGSKSVVQMPGYVAPEFIGSSEGVLQGALTEDTPITSQSLGYAVNYRVYTPAGYESLDRLPVMFVTDGQDFLAFGKLAEALDNLIAGETIRPIMAVFIDPRDVNTGENQRDQQFFDNPQYGRFIVEELVPQIDRMYRTDPSPQARLIIGASNGGYHSLYFALEQSAAFGLIAAFSPSIWHDPAIIETYQKADPLPLKFFLATGVFNDNDYHTRQFQQMLDGKGCELEYLESNEGHSYGNWRGKFDEMLGFFFPNEE